MNTSSSVSFGPISLIKYGSSHSLIPSSCKRERTCIRQLSIDKPFAIFFVLNFFFHHNIIQTQNIFDEKKNTKNEQNVNNFKCRKVNLNKRNVLQIFWKIKIQRWIRIYTWLIHSFVWYLSESLRIQLIHGSNFFVRSLFVEMSKFSTH